MSSSEVYTNSKLNSSSESDLGFIEPSNGRAQYIYSKLLGESICNRELNDTKKNIKIARLATVYGPGFKLNDQRVISELTHQALVNKKIELLDLGTAVREYLYISDAIKALFNITFFGGFPLYNIGAGKGGAITIREVAHKIANLTETSLVIPTNDANPLHASKYVGLDITRYEKEFGAINKISFDQGLQNTISWAQQELYNLPNKGKA
jgi:nucleoside-diphosphate-sugar epimerase